MKRIGITASKIAKGNLALYNVYVVLIATLVSLLLFVLSGCAIGLALLVIGYVLNGLLPYELHQEWMHVVRFCMGVLTAVVVLLNMVAILRNIKLRS